MCLVETSQIPCYIIFNMRTTTILKEMISLSLSQYEIYNQILASNSIVFYFHFFFFIVVDNLGKACRILLPDSGCS